MRHSPSMVPFEGSGDTYLVLEDLGHLGRVWRETAEVDANRETLIRDLLDDHVSFGGGTSGGGMALKRLR